VAAAVVAAAGGRLRRLAKPGGRGGTMVAVPRQGTRLSGGLSKARLEAAAARLVVRAEAEAANRGDGSWGRRR